MLGFSALASTPIASLTSKQIVQLDITGFAAVSYLGSVVTTGTIFDFEAVKDNYSTNRAVYVEENISSFDRTVLVKTEFRKVYVPYQDTVFDRRLRVGSR